MLTHVGRRTGQRHATAAMVLAEDRTTCEVVICSVWGVPQHRFLTQDEALAVGRSFRRSDYFSTRPFVALRPRGS